VKIIFDPIKDRLNQDKHGCSLSMAEGFDWDEALIWEDDRLDYGENRQVALGLIEDRIYCIVFVLRNENLRIISLRKANAREVKTYVES
jgi:uncharacterized protein